MINIIQTYLNAHIALEIALVVLLGVVAQWLAWRIKIAAILPLLLLGFLIGPLLGLLHPRESVGLALPALVSLAVGLILFEGGLTLRLREVRGTHSVLMRLITVGALATWLLTALIARWLVGLTWPISLIFGALIIVTGPTVIGPLLRNVRPNARLSRLLKWEGILIDPIGILVAVLVLEAILVMQHTSTSTLLGSILELLQLLSGFMLVGCALGVLAGVALEYLMKRHLIPPYLTNVVALALVLTTFATANALVDESGLLATTLMGAWLANRDVPGLDSLLHFKEDLTVLFISLLFIVLAADVDREVFSQALQPSYLLLVALVVVVVRPVNILLSSVPGPLTWRERTFLAWIAPRGIVAASVTSLFADELHIAGVPEAEVLVPLVFLVIVVTVLLSSFTSKPLANWLKVAEADPQGFLIMGASAPIREMASALQKQGITVLLADTNWQNISRARMMGLATYYGNPLSQQGTDDIDFTGLGRLLALTPNDEANTLACLSFAKLFGRQNVYQFKPSGTQERLTPSDMQRGKTLFGVDGMTYWDLWSLERRSTITTPTINSTFTPKDLAAHYQEIVPLFSVHHNKVQVYDESHASESLTGEYKIIALVPKDNSPNGQTA